MRTLKYALFLSLLPFLAQAQPGCFVNGPTGGCTPGAQTPTYTQYVGDVTTAYNAGMAAATSPKTVACGAEVIGSATSFVNQGSPFTNATLENEYMDLVVGATGCGEVDLNWDPIAFSASSSYAGVCSGYICATPPESAATNLALYRLMAQHATAKGYKLRISWGPLSTTWTACGGLTGSTLTITQFINCLGPLEATAVEDFNALSPPAHIADNTGTHEPLGFMGTPILGQNFTTTQWNTANTAISAMVKGATGASGIRYGTGFTGGESSYVTATIADESASVDYLGFDVYFGATPSGWSGTFATYMSECAAAVAAGFACTVNEAQAWRWCPSGGSGCSEAQAYTSCGDPMLQNTGVNNAFSRMLVAGMTTAGADYVTQFSTQPMAGFSPSDLLSTSNCSDNSTSGYAAYVLNHLPSAPTLAGSGWQSANNPASLGFQGNFAASGNLLVQ